MSYQEPILRRWRHTGVASLPRSEQYGGRYVVLGGKFDVVEGDWRPVFLVIIEFPRS